MLLWEEVLHTDAIASIALVTVGVTLKTMKDAVLGNNTNLIHFPQLYSTQLWSVMNHSRYHVGKTNNLPMCYALHTPL